MSRLPSESDGISLRNIFRYIQTLLGEKGEAAAKISGFVSGLVSLLGCVQQKWWSGVELAGWETDLGSGRQKETGAAALAVLLILHVTQGNSCHLPEFQLPYLQTKKTQL